MFKWYRRAERCYAYLYDVLPRGDLPFSDWMQSFRCSEWFERGWTLQELLAPRELIFVCRSWEEEIGTRTSLSEEVKEATGIPKQALVQSWSLKDDLGSPKYSIAQVMSWASGRHTTRTEDTAYSLMGLFHISMPLL
ncbi:hypothetical protein EDD36DRAFT_418770 [Exophiala viscosa]|uniref:Uncharacterized protein n=2 Tax=Exophiala viscosa TaxID=2486360 RepID=A0AAN6ICC3_9EURO|nr:hypothetical protein EDD36DRAFT_418770 [Exophiala viscosa]